MLTHPHHDHHKTCWMVLIHDDYLRICICFSAGFFPASSRAWQAMVYRPYKQEEEEEDAKMLHDITTNNCRRSVSGLPPHNLGLPLTSAIQLTLHTWLTHNTFHKHYCNGNCWYRQINTTVQSKNIMVLSCHSWLTCNITVRSRNVTLLYFFPAKKIIPGISRIGTNNFE